MSSAKLGPALIVVVAVLALSVDAFAFPQQNDTRIMLLAEKLTAAKTEDERQALLAARKELVTAELVTALIESADSLRFKGDYEQALSLFRFTQAVAEQIGDQIGVARAVQLIGSVHQNRGQYETALEYFQKSLPLMEAAKYQRGLAISYASIGLIYRLQGDYDKALEYYQQGLNLSEAGGDKNGVANTLNLIGVVHRVHGNGRLALENYRKALALFEETNFQAGIAGMLNNIGNLFLQQGQYELAEESYLKSLALAQTLRNRPQVGQALNNIGRTHRLRLDKAKALEFYQKSLSIREEIGDKVGVARTLQNIAETHTLGGEYERAQDYYQKSLGLFDSLGNKNGLAETTAGIAQLHLLRRDYRLSLEWSERALPLARETAKDNLWQVLANAGTAYQGLKDFDKARASFAESIKVIEEMRADVAGGEQGQQRFFEVNISPYRAMIELLVTQNRWNEAFVYAEQAKARVLLDVLQSGRVNVAKAMTFGEREQESKLRRESVALNSQVTRESQNTKRDEASLVDLKARQQKARLGYEAFQTNLYAAHPELKVQRGEVRLITPQDTGALLPDAQTALIEYVVAEDRTYFFVLTKGDAGHAQPDLRVYTVDVKQKGLAEQAERFRRQLAQRDLTYTEAARRLYDLLLKPAEAQLDGKKTLIIVPDGKLWELPFQALQDTRGQHLIESHAVSYAPSLSVLREMIKARQKESRGAPLTLLAVGNPTLGNETIQRAKSGLMDGMDERFDPLLEAEKQVVALGKLYGSARSRVYFGPAAREGRVKTEAGRYRILQLATHAVLNDVSPMYSHILLAEEEGNLAEDGLLEAWELMNLNLNADLVVLSACETARGRIGAGEGVIGLTWALFVAGSPTTIVSQWKVESASTTELMMEFHRNLRRRSGNANGLSTTEALQGAAKKMLASREYSHPFYWAGFVVVGDGRRVSPVKNSEKQNTIHENTLDRAK